MSAQLLDLLLTYGVLALAPILAASALGLPIPSSLLLLAGGAFAGSGQLALLPLIVVGIIATSFGDSLGYWLGRRGGVAALERFGPRIGIKPTALAQADAFLGRWGGVAILLTRFLLTPLGPVINIVAGTGRYPYRRFLAYDALGEAIWVILYLALGYLFSASWDVLADILGRRRSSWRSRRSRSSCSSCSSAPCGSGRPAPSHGPRSPRWRSRSPTATTAP